MPASRRHVALVAGLGLVSSALIFTPTPAQAAGPGLVIDEVYGAGGNAGATYTTDFIELHNTTGAPIELLGKSIQYRATTGTGFASTANVYALPDAELGAGEKFLIAGADGCHRGRAPDDPRRDVDAGTRRLRRPGHPREHHRPDRPQRHLRHRRHHLHGRGHRLRRLRRRDEQLRGHRRRSRAGRDHVPVPRPGRGHRQQRSRLPARCTHARELRLHGATGHPRRHHCRDPGHDRHVAEPLRHRHHRGRRHRVVPAGGFNGFYLQTGGAPATAGASDAIFVFLGSSRSRPVTTRPSATPSR